MVGRSLLTWPLLWIAVLGLTPSALAAQEGALTAQEAVRRALERPANVDILEGTVEVARSEAVREGLWQNPEISYSREDSRSAQNGAQDVLMVSQSFDVSGRRSLRSHAAELRARAAEHRGSGTAARLTAEVQLRFYELLVAQLRPEVVSAWVERIEAALAIVMSREAAGDASVYERRRLERELANARARLALHQAARGVAWVRLAAVMGQSDAHADNPPQLAGELLPDGPRSLAELLAHAEERPALLALDARVEAAQADGEAASRGWIPQFSLGGGWTAIDLTGGGRTHGYVAMATMSVPLFDRNQDESLRARAEERVAHGQRVVAVTTLQGAIRGRAFELQQLVDAARRFRDEAVASNEALLGIAEAGYAGGELGILELLDANRGATDDEMTALELDFSARDAHIRLDLLTGDGAR